MLDLKKIKYSFVLCLALLFSFSFAGTLTINDTDFDLQYLQYDLTIESFSENYFLAYTYVIATTYSDYAYLLMIYDYTEFLDNLSVLGLVDRTESYNYYLIRHLKQQSQGYYTLSTPYCVKVLLYSDRIVVINDNADVFYPLTDNTITINGAAQQDYNLTHYQNFIDIIHTPYDVYEFNGINDDTEGTLGDLVSSTTGYVPYLPFTTSLTQQEVDETVFNFYNSSSIFDNLPSEYSNFFIMYSESTESFSAFVFPKNVYPVGYIDENEQYTISFKTPPDVNYVNDFNVYIFNSINLFQDYNYSNLVPSQTIATKWGFSYRDNPIIYTNVAFPFYQTNNGVLHSPQDFVLLNSPLNVDGNDIYLSDLLGQDKTISNIWNKIESIFNPGASAGMSAIEDKHDDIINKAEFGNFKSEFENSSNEFYLIATFEWLILANNALFLHFSGFIVLCCLLITISRVLR